VDSDGISVTNAGYSWRVLPWSRRLLSPVIHRCSGTADAAPTDPANAKARTLGFAVTSLPYALAKNADDCPDGMAMAPKALYLQSFRRPSGSV